MNVLEKLKELRKRMDESKTQMQHIEAQVDYDRLAYRAMPFLIELVEAMQVERVAFANLAECQDTFSPDGKFRTDFHRKYSEAQSNLKQARAKLESLEV